MSDNPAGENSIDSLADRAKEMLERVRGASESIGDAAEPTPAAPVEPTPPTAVDAAPNDVAEAEPEVVEPEVDAVEVEPEPEIIEIADEAEIGIELPELVDVESNDVESNDDEGSLVDDRVEEASSEALDEIELPEGEDDTAPEFADVRDAEADSPDLPDEDTGSSSSSRLGQLANKAKESLDSVAGTPTAVAATAAESIEDVTADTNVAETDLTDSLDDSGFDRDDQTIELPEISIESPDDALTDESEERGGFIDSFGSSEDSINVDDLSPIGFAGDLDTIDASKLDTQEIDIPFPDVDDDSSTIAGVSASTAGSAVVAGTAAAAVDDAAFGLDADIVTKDASPFAEVPAKREPHIDTDLNDLFIEPTEPEERTRAFSWLVPLGFLALIAFGLVWWLNGDGTSDDSSSLDSGQAQVDDADSDPTDDTDASQTGSTTDTASSTTATTESATSSTESTTTETTEAPLPATAWELLGEDSNTTSFAALGGPLGLQAALEQQVDENGEPLSFTLFAPSNDALQKLSDAELTALAEDPATAGALVDYHFVLQRITPELLVESIGGELPTRSGAPIFVTQDGDDIVLNGEARLSLAGLEAANGNVIVIDTVLQPPSVNTLLDLDNIEFQVISSVLTPEGEAELQKAVAFFNENPDTTALIEGHTDTDGESDANLRLSDRRAQAVRQFLISQGIDGSRLVARGFGETEPILVDGLEDKDASRRIEFTLQ